jgi:hypothetical protein
MKGVPVTLGVRAMSAGYSPRRVYFSKAPGFMLPIARAIVIVHQRKVKLTRLKAAKKRKVKLTRLRVARKRRVKLTRFRVAKNQKSNSFLGWVTEGEPVVG